MIRDDQTPEKRWCQPLREFTELTNFCHKLNILRFCNMYLCWRNLISCKAALQRLFREKCYTNNLEFNWIHQALSGWMGADRHFQVSPEMFDWVQVQSHSMRLLPAHFTVGMLLCRWWALSTFFQTWCLELRFIRLEKLVSHSLRVT